MKIFICGFSGSGKTTYLESLKNNPSADYNFDFIDLDQKILEEIGIGYNLLGEWFKNNSESQFRQIEYKILDEVLKKESNLIVALGGGALSDNAYKLIRSEQSNYLVFLDTDLSLCISRIKKDPNRLLSRLDNSELESIYLARKFNYQKADLIISPDDLKFIDGIDRLVHNLMK